MHLSWISKYMLDQNFEGILHSLKVSQLPTSWLDVKKTRTMTIFMTISKYLFENENGGHFAADCRQSYIMRGWVILGGGARGEKIWPYTEKDNINSTNANLSHDPLHFVLEIKGQCNFIKLQFGTLCEIKMQVIKLKTRLSDLGKCFLERTIPFQQMTSFAPFSWNCVFNIIWRCKLGIWEKDSWPQTHSSSQRTQTSIRMGEKKTQKRLLVYFRYLWRKGFYGPFLKKIQHMQCSSLDSNRGALDNREDSLQWPYHALNQVFLRPLHLPWHLIL